MAWSARTHGHMHAQHGVLAQPHACITITMLAYGLQASSHTCRTSSLLERWCLARHTMPGKAELACAQWAPFTVLTAGSKEGKHCIHRFLLLYAWNALTAAYTTPVRSI
eukprot:scaffold167857_cov19-Tisochrysis_lutea.AAC.1